MKKNRIETNILFIILYEALFCMFLFKINIINFGIAYLLSLTLISLFNKIKPSKAISLLFIVISSLLFIVSFYQLITFIRINLLTNNSLFLISFFTLITIFLLTKGGYSSFIKIVETTFYLIIILKIMSFFFLIPTISLQELDFQNIFKINYLEIIYGIIVLFILNYNYYSLVKKEICFKEHISSFLNLLSIKLITLLTLGNKLTYYYKYPYIIVFQKINYLSFFERMDGILSYIYLFDYFFLLAFIIIFIKESLKILSIHLHYTAHKI